jgi:hypothetical protein
MECPFGPLPFGSLQNKTEESHSSRRAYLKRVCRLRFSFFANDQPIPLARALGRPAQPAADWVWFMGL